MNLSALSGMNAADLLFSATADNTANVSTPDHLAEQVEFATDPTGGVLGTLSFAQDPGVDLGEQMTNLGLAGVMYQVNARVLQAQSETTQSLFDMLA